MGFTNCLINGAIVGALVLYTEDATYVRLCDRWIKASWNEERHMWSIEC